MVEKAAPSSLFLLPMTQPTRAEGLARLANFTPLMGRLYSNNRNFDPGPGKPAHVSVLSPYIRHRLITEQEVVAAAIAAHGAEVADKFIQEVFWRSYWKGWLAQRPTVWAEYRARVAAGLQTPPEGYAAAIAGRTGIACFDAWAAELAGHGYLHNHARMWTASIWIFTLRLPWELGADWFLRHLADGDPASNTLSWRWVGGLQTRGKHYLARAANIAEYSNGRFDPRGELDEGAAPLPADAPFERQPLRPSVRPQPGVPAGLLLTVDDLHPESAFAASPGIDWTAAAFLDAPDARGVLPAGTVARAFRAGALADAGRRWTAASGLQPDHAVAVSVVECVDWARAHGLRQVVAPHACVGPMRPVLDALGPALDAHGIALVQWQRRWDAAAWPHAARGFFNFREHIGKLVADCDDMNLSA